MVRRIARILLAVSLLLLVSCNRDAVTPENVTDSLSSSYNTKAVVEYQDIKANLEMIKSEGRCEVTFDSPASLKDLSFDYNGDLVTVKYGKLSFSVEPDSMPGQALSSLLVSSLNTALNDRGVSVKQEDNAIKVVGQTNGSDFELVLDRKNGNALSLKVPEDDLSLQFYNFSFIS